MMTINIHGVKSVRARLEPRLGSCWVDFIFDSFGHDQEITVFFEDRAVAERIVDAIRDANAEMTLVKEPSDA
jgi:hypothetical protein